MELDEFKQKVKEKPAPEINLHSAVELEGYMRNQTSSVISKIKRSILLELLASCILAAVAVWVWFRYSVPYIRACAMLSIFLCCFLFIYLAALHKKINRYERAPSAVKNNLQQIIIILEQFTRAYFQFTMITLPIAFVFGFITGFITISGDAIIKNFQWQRAMLFYTAWFIVWAILMYFFSKWYIKKLYGNYLVQLRQQLKDIENG